MMKKGHEMEIRQILVLFFLGGNGLYDIRKREISIASVIVFVIASLPLNKWTGQLSWYEVVLGAFAGVVLLVISKLTAESIGYGDGLVALVMGLYVGIWKSLSVLFCGLLFASIFSIILVNVKKRGWKSKIPFIPFLLISYVVNLAIGG